MTPSLYIYVLCFLLLSWLVMFVVTGVRDSLGFNNRKTEKLEIIWVGTIFFCLVGLVVCQWLFR